MVENVCHPKSVRRKLKCMKQIVLSTVFDGLMQLFQRVSVEKLKQEKQINMSEFSHSMFVLFIVFKDDRG